MCVPNFNSVTLENLESFLNNHKTIPLPEWFPIREIESEPCKEKETRRLVANVDINGLTILPYIRGCMSYIEAKDIVISYPFSGCLMSLFKFDGESNKQYVAHIAKGDGIVKNELCDGFKKDNTIKIIRIFDPHDEPSKKFKNILKDYCETQCYGIICSDSKCYWLVVGRKKNNNSYIIIDWAEVKRESRTKLNCNIL